MSDYSNERFLKFKAAFLQALDTSLLLQEDGEDPDRDGVAQPVYAAMEAMLNTAPDDEFSLGDRVAQQEGDPGAMAAACAAIVEAFAHDRATDRLSRFVDALSTVSFDIRERTIQRAGAWVRERYGDKAAEKMEADLFFGFTETVA